ncbi:MAG: DUF502 domain-containing protein [Nitrospinota bacterium]
MFKWIKKIFLAGLLVTLPVVSSIFFSIFLFNSIDQILGPAVTKILILLGAPIHPTYRIPGLGIVITVLIVFGVGLLVTNYIGKKFVLVGEKILQKIPVVRSIYSAVKQIIETIASANASVFQQVVMFEFPRKGIYSLGFISSEAQGEAQEKTQEEVVNVFIPTVPNITTGFFLLVPRTDITPLSMTVEEGVKLMISGGILVPDRGDNKENPNKEG